MNNKHCLDLQYSLQCCTKSDLRRQHGECAESYYAGQTASNKKSAAGQSEMPLPEHTHEYTHKDQRPGDDASGPINIKQ